MALLAAFVSSLHRSDPVESSDGKKAALIEGVAKGTETQLPRREEASLLYLTANDLSIATGNPSLVLMSSGSTHIPVWSLSGGTTGQSVAGVVGALLSNCAA